MITAPQAKAAAWAALAATAKKELERSVLKDGTELGCQVRLQANVEGAEYSAELLGVLKVGMPSERSSSSGPDTAHLVAYLLVHVPKKLREKILAELPENYQAAGNALPPVKPETLDRAAKLLERLRAKETTTVSGALTFPSYKLSQNPFPPAPASMPC